MSSKKQRRWNELRAIFIATTGSTIDRSTEIDDYSDEEKVSNGYIGTLYAPLSADV